MKIGILTWFFAANYGAKAHTLALQNYVKTQGHDVEIVNYRPSDWKKINLRMNIKRKNIFDIAGNINGVVKCKKLGRFNEKYKLSKLVHNAAEIDCLEYDLIIIGSDEILNLVHPLSESIYYGVDLKTPFCMYAPSMGQMPAKIKVDDRYIKSVSKAIGLSVRDEYSLNIINKWIEDVGEKKNVIQVCDPTFLYEFKINKQFGIPKYILIYSFEDLSLYKERIQEYALTKDCKIVVIGRKCKWADYSYPDASEEEWISSFTTAQLVITDSFHGTIFAIKNKVQYVVIGREDKINKIDGLHKYFNIKKSYYDVKYCINDYLAKTNMDYKVIEKNIDEKVNESKNYLDEVFNKLK